MVVLFQRCFSKINDSLKKNKNVNPIRQNIGNGEFAGHSFHTFPSKNAPKVNLRFERKNSDDFYHQNPRQKNYV